MKFKYNTKGKYGYELIEAYKVQTGICLPYDVTNVWVTLKASGELLIADKYNYDGATGAFDTNTIMRGALVHDSLYQLLQEGLLPWSYRKQIDKLFVKICREDGMSWFRAKYVYYAVRAFGKIAMKIRSK